MNEIVTKHVLQTLLDYGVEEFIICAGSRNSAFVQVLRLQEHLKCYYWPEERSGAFFALGRSRLTNRPVAVIVTSGTAAAELLPAAMEAYYSGVPLLLITADRPRTFRGSGSPQSPEQVGLFGIYARYAQDIDKDSVCTLAEWDQQGPAHLNVCLEEPQSQSPFAFTRLVANSKLAPNESLQLSYDSINHPVVLDRFFNQAKNLLVIVSTLPEESREATIDFLIKLGAPLHLESLSGLRDDSRLQHLRIRRTDKILETAREMGYEIDSVLRIGGVPTHRIWRDLEYLRDKVRVCSISRMPFSGLSWNRWVVHAPVHQVLTQYCCDRDFSTEVVRNWMEIEKGYEKQLEELVSDEPTAEVSLVHDLAKIIPNKSHIYLGNGLPVREWDLSASEAQQEFSITATRGMCGIDGQISTFLGLCQPQIENWAILGDLTTLYDMAGFWILPQLEAMSITLVIINNAGGRIFERVTNFPEMLNIHSLSFEPLAKMWGLEYERWERIPSAISKKQHRLIEIVPDLEASSRFLNKLATCKPNQKQVTVSMQ